MEKKNMAAKLPIFSAGDSLVMIALNFRLVRETEGPSISFFLMCWNMVCEYRNERSGAPGSERKKM